MFTKIELKIKKLFKKKDTKKEPYQRLIEKIQKKTEKLSGKKDKDSLEALSIYNMLILKLEKRLQRYE